MDSSENILQEKIIVITTLYLHSLLVDIYHFGPYYFNHRTFKFSQSYIDLFIYSVLLMSIMDHYRYATRPLVEYNLDLYTDRASFLGWLEHMSERKRLAIILDPSVPDPARTKKQKSSSFWCFEKGGIRT